MGLYKCNCSLLLLLLLLLKLCGKFCNLFWPNVYFCTYEKKTSVVYGGFVLVVHIHQKFCTFSAVCKTVSLK